MKTYIAVLRGVNVAGARSIRMEDLKSLCRDLGFSHVSTYIQSGNIVFLHDQINKEALAGLISSEMLARFDLEVPAIVLESAELSDILSANPFLPEMKAESDKLHVTLLSRIPETGLALKIADLNFLPDQFLIMGRVIYLYCPNGYGRTKINNGFFEKKLNIPATTRNIRTMEELLRISLDKRL